MKKNKSEKIPMIVKIFVPLLAISILISIIGNIFIEINFMKCHRYSIGEILYNISNVEGSNTIGYKCLIFNKIHTGERPKTVDFKIAKGDRFYIVFCPSDTSYHKLLLDNPVPDSLTVVPQGGWEVIPNAPY